MEQARLPADYESAVTALGSCMTIDDTKTFENQAEALAAWAKIYKHDEAGKVAKRLKLHAHKRMGELATELANREVNTYTGQPEPNRILRAEGLTRGMADAALYLARMPEDRFKKAVEDEKPKAPTTVAKQDRYFGQSYYKDVRAENRTPFSCETFIANNLPETCAAAMTEDDYHRAVHYSQRLIRWLQNFNRAGSRT